MRDLDVPSGSPATGGEILGYDGTAVATPDAVQRHPHGAQLQADGHGHQLEQRAVELRDTGGAPHVLGDLGIACGLCTHGGGDVRIAEPVGDVDDDVRLGERAMPGATALHVQMRARDVDIGVSLCRGHAFTMASKTLAALGVSRCPNRPIWNRMTVHTRLVAMTNTSRALIAVLGGVALAAAVLAPMRPSATPPPPTSASSVEFVTWCPDETLIQGGQWYAWQVRRC